MTSRTAFTATLGSGGDVMDLGDGNSKICLGIFYLENWGKIPIFLGKFFSQMG